MNNIEKPSTEALTDAISILMGEKNTSEHFSKYPQDRFRDDEKKPNVTLLLSTAEFHKKRAERLQQVIQYLYPLIQQPEGGGAE